MRAILLAAGMGTRLNPLTLETPKPLIKIDGKPMIERQIEFLIEKGIKDIIVVTGYLNEKFEYLKDKYEVKIIYNDKFSEYNNIYTMYLVRSYLGNSYVIDTDIYLHENFIDSKIKRSTYFSAYKTKYNNEWKLVYDVQNRVEKIYTDSGEGYILSGMSFWTMEDAQIIIQELEKCIEKKLHTLYWDDIVKNNITKLNVYIEKINSNACFEIDNINDLEYVEKYIKYVSVKDFLPKI